MLERQRLAFTCKQTPPLSTNHQHCFDPLHSYSLQVHLPLPPWQNPSFWKRRLPEELRPISTLNLKWLSQKMIFNCMFLSCHVRVSEWIHTLYLPECQELLARNRLDIWRLRDCNRTRTHNHLARKWTLTYDL